jgi:acetophenone carboxylase
MDAFGFPWCVFGRAPDTELVENEFPLLVPLSSHWKNSCGHGKFRGGVGTVQMWVAHHVPMVFMMAIADNSKLQTPQPLFGGYAPPTVPGISIRRADVMKRMAENDPKLTMQLEDILQNKTISGNFATEFQGRSIRPYDNGDVITFGFSTGGTGYGDPLDRDPASVITDVKQGLVSDWAAENVYCIAWDKARQRLDKSATEALRAAKLAERRSQGRSYQSFEKEWLTKKPPADILSFYGSWPDAKTIHPLMRA